MRQTSSGKKLSVLISAVLAVLVLAGSGVFAWFTSQKDYIQGQIDIGTMEVAIHVYKYENGSLIELDGTADENEAHTGQSSANSEGIITYSDWDADSAGVRYIAIENKGTIDVKSYLTLQGILGSSMNENSLDYFHFLINPISELTGSSLNTSGLSNYAAGYTQTGASEIAAHSSSFKLTEYSKSTKIGEIERKTVNYYRLDFCCYNLPTKYIPQTSKVEAADDYSARINASINVKQKNAPENDNDNAGNSTYVDSAAAFVEAVRAAANNDTIFLMQNIEVNDSITILQRVNINLNGHTLIIRGNLAYDTASAGHCSLVISGSSRLYVWGDLIIDMPNAMFELIGSGSSQDVGNAAIILGHYNSETDEVEGGEFYVDCMRDYNHTQYGYTQTAAQVWVWTGSATAALATMEVDSETGVKINSNSVTGIIKAYPGAHDIAVYNYGEIKQLDLSAMNYSGSGEEQIYILNCNKFTDTGDGLYAVIMPPWAVGHITGPDLNPPRDTNARAINSAGATVGWHVTSKNGEGQYAGYYFFDVDIESGFTGGNQVIRNDVGDYTVILVNESDNVHDLLAAFFAENPDIVSEWSGMTHLTIVTYENGTVKPADFSYMRQNLTQLNYLNLEYALMLGGAIPSSAMNGATNLTELILPISEISIGDNAFAGTSIEFLTISNNVTSIGANAFSVAADAHIYITWDSTVPVDNTILQGFAMNRTVIFMYEYLLGDFRTAYPNYAYRAYEHYDFFDEGSNGFYKILTNESAQLIYYRGTLVANNTLAIPASVTNNGYTYSVTTLGEYSYRLAISLQSSLYVSIDMPVAVKTIERGVFYNAKLNSLTLNNVTSIGADAFRKAQIKYSSERPTSFTGMTYLGAYAFGNVTLGTTVSGTLSEELFNSMTSSGTLDLSGSYIPEDNALNSLKVWKGTLKLNDLGRISGSIVTNMGLYGTSLYVDNVDTILNGTFNGKFNAFGKNYNNVYARNVKRLGGNAFANNGLNDVYVGLDASLYADQGAVDMDCQYGNVEGSTTSAGIFPGCNITTLNISGWIPRSATETNTNALFAGSATYGTVNIDYAGDTLPDYMFNGSNNIGQLNISSNVEVIGKYAFCNCTIGNTTLDMSNIAELGERAFQNAKLNSLAAITLADGAVMGSNCFANASLSSITSMDFSDIYSIGERAFYQITGGGITHIDVSGVYIIGANAFYGVKNNEGCTIDEIDITSAMKVGSSAFGGLNIEYVRMGNTGYYNEHPDEYSYGAWLFSSTANDVNIGTVSLDGEMPVNSGRVLAGYGSSLTIYDLLYVTSGCTLVSNSLFSYASYSDTNRTGVFINGFASESDVNIGSSAFAGVGFGNGIDFSKVTSIAQRGFYGAYVSPNIYWNFESIKILSSGEEFLNTFGGPLTIAFNSIEEVRSYHTFYNSSALEALYFGANLTSFTAPYPIDHCSNLRSITLTGPSPAILGGSFITEYTGNGGESGVPGPGFGTDSGLTIYVPSDALPLYAEARYWSALYAAGYFAEIGNTMESSDGNYSFHIITDNGLNRAVIRSYNGSGTTLSIPATITGANGASYTVAEIADGAFQGTSLTSVTIPASVVFINPGAFTGTAITSISVASDNNNYSAQNGVLYTKDGSVLIYYCGALTSSSFNVPTAVRTIAKNAFKDAIRLTTLTMSGVTTIDGGAFGGNCAVNTFNFNSATPPVLLSNEVFGILRTAQVDGDIVYYIKRGDITINIPAGSFTAYANGINWHPFIQCLNESSRLLGVELGKSLSYGSFSFVVNDDGNATITGFDGSGDVRIPAYVTDDNGARIEVDAVMPTAFNDAEVTAFAVSADNRHFSADEHGVLYSKDGTVLIRYPAASADTGYEVPAGVTRIEAYAFAGAEKLEVVYIPTDAMRNMGEQVFSGCSDKLALYGGAAANPFAVELPEAILPEEQGDEEDGADSHPEDNTGAGSGEGPDGNNGSEGEGEGSGDGDAVAGDSMSRRNG
mgnify:CR=1 FL=1